MVEYILHVSVCHKNATQFESVGKLMLSVFKLDFILLSLVPGSQKH